MRLLLQVVLNAAGLVVTATLVPGVDYDGGLPMLLVAGAVIGLVNLIVKPIVTVLSLPFILLTLGLFFLLINGAMLALAASLVPGLEVAGCGPAVLGGLVMALFNWLVRAFDRKER